MIKRFLASVTCTTEGVNHGHRSRSRFRNPQRPRDALRQRKRPPRHRQRRVSAASQTRRPGLRHAVARRPDGCAGRAPRRQAIETAGIDGSSVEAIALDTTGSSVIPVDDRLEPLDDYYLWCDHRAKEEAAADHRAGARRAAGSHRMVRRRLFARVGLRQAAALAAPQPRQARAILSPRSSTATWSPALSRHHRRDEGKAQRLRHGPQMDVESEVGRPAAAGIPLEARSALRRSSRNVSMANT